MDRWRYPHLRPGGDRAAVFLCGAIARRGWPGARRRDSRHVMTALAISNIVLWIVVICLVFVLLALTRQLGVLHERIAPAGALMIHRGPAIGEAVAAVDVVDLAGRELRIGAASADGRSTLILFVSPTCPVCKTLLAVARASAQQ